MKSNIYRCGWCGLPVNEHGNFLSQDKYIKAVNILEKYGDYRTIKVNGECCKSCAK